jgi:hypothetical protein
MGKDMDTINLLPSKNKTAFRRYGLAVGILLLLLAIQGGRYGWYYRTYQQLLAAYQPPAAVQTQADIRLGSDLTDMLEPTIFPVWLDYVHGVWPETIFLKELQADAEHIRISGAASAYRAAYSLLTELSANPFGYHLSLLESQFSGGLDFTAEYSR